MTHFRSVARLAGFFAAHGIWCVSDGGPLIPMFAHESVSGERGMDRLASDLLQDAVATGRLWLKTNPRKVARAVLVADGYVNLPLGRSDALIIEAAGYEDPTFAFEMFVPYRLADSPQGFAVFRPKFGVFSGVPHFPFEVVAEEFFRGVDSHENGAQVWNAHIDQSQ